MKNTQSMKSSGMFSSQANYLNINNNPHDSSYLMISSSSNYASLQQKTRCHHQVTKSSIIFKLSKMILIVTLLSLQLVAYSATTVTELDVSRDDNDITIHHHREVSAQHFAAPANPTSTTTIRSASVSILQNVDETKKNTSIDLANNDNIKTTPLQEANNATNLDIPDIKVIYVSNQNGRQSTKISTNRTIQTSPTPSSTTTTTSPKLGTPHVDLLTTVGNSSALGSHNTNHTPLKIDQTSTIIVNSSEAITANSQSSNQAASTGSNSPWTPSSLNTTNNDIILKQLSTNATTTNTTAVTKTQKVKSSKFHCESSLYDCHNGALCHNGICFCLPGFTGLTCELNIDECRQFASLDSSVPCLNGGQCVDEINSYRCECAPGYQGERCQDEVNLCADDLAPCQNQANCVNHRTHYECQCKPGWRGNECQTNIDDCASSPCRNGARCNDLVDDFKCECLPGWTGKQCQLNIDECAANPCWKNSTITCLDLINDFQCECLPGFEGKRCELNIDDCLRSPCLNEGQCTDLVNGYKCSCPNEWTGDQCELDVNECEKSPPGSLCKYGGLCENLEPSYKCHCGPGWTGKNCQDIEDYCLAKQPCSLFGSCKNLNTTGEPFKCECQSGYLGTRCDIRRNCENECHPEHGNCVRVVSNQTSLVKVNNKIANTKSQHSGSICACQPGSPELRTMCELVSSCEQIEGELCHNGGHCRNLPAGGYECQCPPGFQGPICQFTESKSTLEPLVVVAMGCAACLLAACAVVSLLVFRSVRKARATRGTYSPSTQEKFENSPTVGNIAPNNNLSDLLRPPIPERLI